MQKQNLFGLLFIAALAILPVIAVDLPRFYAIGPGLIGIAAIAALWFSTKTKPAVYKSVWIFPLTLFALGLLSVLWSIVPDVSLERALKLLGIFIPGGIFLTAINMTHQGRLRPHLYLLPLSIIAAAILTCVEIHLEQPLYRLIRGIDNSEHVPRAVFNRGAVAAMLCAFPVYFILKNHTQNLALKVVFFIALAAMLLSVESQSAQLGAILGIAAFWLFPYSRPKAWYVLIGLVTVLIFSAPFLAIWMFKNLAPALDNMPFLGKGYGYAGGRLEIWDYVSRYLLNKPLLGHGIEATKTITDFDSGRIYHEGSHILHPHNFAIQFWIEFGALGAAAASALCGYLLFLIKNINETAQRIALPSFIAALSVAATGYGFWQSWWLGLLFMVAGLCVIANKQTSNK